MRKEQDVELIKFLSSSEKGQQNKCLRLIYNEYYDPFNRFFLKQNADQATIEDIFQDSIIGLYMNVRKPDFYLSSSLQTYLIAIGKNIWHKKLRKKKETIDIDGLYNVGVADEYLELWDKKNEIEKIKKLMEQLGTSCKDLLTMFYLDRYSMKDIALRLNYANDQVARNKKSKCMSTLISLVKSNNG